ncbi:hypothetical protein L596_028888 [Steinernema carpocapsae]|uniref:Uncharacterized protein n=1 Tax=Steinernema carpocapsae TaxID=34508 RepID=A0A4U5M0R5_STECR|nr:hypothetical protein L596_028888 [Steinernema carpocapsae]
MAINPTNVLKLLAMQFPEHQSTEDYSNFEEEIANGILDYLEDVCAQAQLGHNPEKVHLSSSSSRKKRRGERTRRDETELAAPTGAISVSGWSHFNLVNGC